MNLVHDESAALRHAVGILESFPRALLSVRGADRCPFLHNLLTHDIKGCAAGQGRPACLLDRQGKIRASFLVQVHEDQILLETDPAHLAAAQEGLQKYLISEDVELNDVTSQHRVIPIHGPRAEELLQKCWPNGPLPAASGAHCKGPADSGIGWIFRWDLLRLPGYHLWVDPALESALRKTILTGGESLGMRSIGRETFEMLRIEAGVPWPGKEIDETVILNELGAEEWVSFTKGCFVGQEIVARIKYRAHPPRTLRGFFLEGGAAAVPRCAIELESKEVGAITSACFSSALGRVIALGFLKFEVAGGDLIARAPGRPLHATVAELPFVK